MALLEIKDLSVTYRNNNKSVYAVNKVNLFVEQGDSVGIVGESGSGKTTLMMAVLNLLNKRTAFVSGEVFLEDKDLLQMTAKELTAIRWKEMAIVFQKSMNALSPVHTIGTFLGDIYRSHMDQKISKAEIETYIKELLRLVNLPDTVYKMYPHELSGGMMQRVSIAMGVMFHPKILIMDEATTALDVVTQNQILAEIINLEQKLSMTRIMITHDMSVVANTCKKVVIMYAGEVVEVGCCEDVLVEPMHPYTQGLISSYPRIDESGEKHISSMGGGLPDLGEPIEYCIFCDRCKYSTDLCREKKPEMTEISKGWWCKCHRVLGNAESEK